MCCGYDAIVCTKISCPSATHYSLQDAVDSLRPEKTKARILIHPGLHLLDRTVVLPARPPIRFECGPGSPGAPPCPLYARQE